MVEKETVFVRYLDKSLSEDKIIKVHTSLVNLADLKSGSPDGIVSAIQSSFEGIGISIDDLGKKIVGFGADGAAENQGGERGAIASLRESYGLWITFLWCMSHRLELSIKDALGHRHPF